MEKFWMVYDPQNGPPQKHHEYQQNAEDEAVRLARRHPGRKFVVLEAIAVHEVALPPVTRMVLEEAPF